MAGLSFWYDARMNVGQLKQLLERIDERIELQVLLEFRERGKKSVFGDVETVEECLDDKDRNGDRVLFRCSELRDSEV